MFNIVLVSGVYMRLQQTCVAAGASRILLGEAAWRGREAARAFLEEPEDAGGVEEIPRDPHRPYRCHTLPF